MDHRDAFDAIRLVYHSDIPDALLREVIEKAIRDHREETESQKDEDEARLSGPEKEAGAQGQR
jgi:hypothetical protein